MSINQFITEVKKRGMSRLNRYEVIITPPKILSNKTEYAPLMNLFCESVTLPGLNFATVPMTVYGERREMPYEKTFDSVTMSFYVDSGMGIKKFFDGWADRIIDPVTKVAFYHNEYSTAIDIIVLGVGEKLDKSYKVTLHEAYPKTINAVQLDASSRDVMKLNVTFAYKWWSTHHNYKGGGRMGTATQQIHSATTKGIAGANNFDAKSTPPNPDNSLPIQMSDMAIS